MKRFILIVLTLGLVIFGCDTGNGTNGDEFTTSTNETISNDVDTLGLIGASVVSSNLNVATAEITVTAKIKITSASEGTAVITVSDGTNNATISVTVSKTGSITIGAIVKYSGSTDIVPSQLIGTYRFTEGGRAGDSDFDIIITSTTFTWAGEEMEIVSVTSDAITVLFYEDGTSEEWDINYELNGDILKVKDGQGEWQERVRVGTSPFTGTWVSNQYQARMIIGGSTSLTATLQLGNPFENAAKGSLVIEETTATLTYTHVWKNGSWSDNAQDITDALPVISGTGNPMVGTVTGSTIGSILFGHMVKQ